MTPRTRTSIGLKFFSFTRISAPSSLQIPSGPIVAIVRQPFESRLHLVIGEVDHLGSDALRELIFGHTGVKGWRIIGGEGGEVGSVGSEPNAAAVGRDREPEPGPLFHRQGAGIGHAGANAVGSGLLARVAVVPLKGHDDRPAEDDEHGEDGDQFEQRVGVVCGPAHESLPVWNAAGFAGGNSPTRVQVRDGDFPPPRRSIADDEDLYTQAAIHRLGVFLGVDLEPVRIPPRVDQTLLSLLEG